MRTRGAWIATALASAMLAAPRPAAAQQTHLVVIAGVEGDAEHGKQFHEWAVALIGVAKGRYSIPASNIIYLTERPERDAALSAGPSTKQRIEQTFASLAQRAGGDDQLVVVLIGHGSSDSRAARFSLPGPDMTAEDFAAQLVRFKTQPIVFANTASSSGDFLPVLSAKGRTILTATRSGAERFDTRFAGFLFEALGNDEADLDKDRRVSFLEAFNYARTEVVQAYQREGLLQTEHALLDDDGDGRGTAEPSTQTADGRQAAALFLATRETTAAASLPSDPALRALYEQRQAIEQRIDTLKRSKPAMDSTKYESELEQLLTQLALKTREIRQLEGNKP